VRYLFSKKAIAAVIAAGSMASALAVSSGSAFAYYSCEPGWGYYVTTTYGQVHDGQGPTFEDYNGTPYNATATFTSTTTGTVGVGISVAGTFDISAIVAGAQVTTTLSLDASTSYSYGNSISITIPPWGYGYGQYGVWRWKTYGEYYYVTSNCQTTNVQWITTWVPRNYPGWATWL
jgi:hypothetical protein